MDPSDIIYYNLLQYVRPERIDLERYESLGAERMLPSGLIIINKSRPLDEQVKTVLHEIIHMHPRFIAYTGGLFQGTLTRDEQIESEIESLAQRTFAERPDIVDFVRKKLAEAYMHHLNLRG